RGPCREAIDSAVFRRVNQMKSTTRAKTSRELIVQIWQRARINAFAHREASNEAATSAHKYFKREVGSALSGIFFVVLAYVFSTSDHDLYRIPSTVSTLAAVVMTLISLYFSVLTHRLKLDVKEVQHERLVNSYLYLAQRTREAQWPAQTEEGVDTLLKDLERDFQILKATGTEPQNHHFERAQEIFVSIGKDEDVSGAQSYDLKTAYEEAEPPEGSS
ncbi:MAG: hypothetical protein ACREYE_18405, partial [Gammaproteobacteria bacterium]